MIQCTHNRLIISIDTQFADRRDIGNGRYLFIETKFNPEEKVSLTAKVESLPRAIRNGPGQTLALGALAVGDTIMIRYDVLAETRDQPDRDSIKYQHQIMVDGVPLWFCDIEQVLARRNDGAWEMMNDYVMISPVVDATEQIGLIIVPEHYRRKRLEGVGRVISGPDSGEMVRFAKKFAQEYSVDGEPILIIRERYVMGTEASA
jgi:hypothetical protein